MCTEGPRLQSARPREGGDPVLFARCLDPRTHAHFAKGVDSRRSPSKTGVNALMRGNERVGRRLANAGAGVATLLAALALAFAIVPAQAQDYPSRPITLIVPYAAGGGNDVMARTVAEKMRS